MKKIHLNILLTNLIDDIENVDGVKAATKTDYNLQVVSDSDKFDDLTDWLKDYFKENHPKIDIEDIFVLDSLETKKIGNFHTLIFETININLDKVID